MSEKYILSSNIYIVIVTKLNFNDELSLIFGINYSHSQWVHSL